MPKRVSIFNDHGPKMTSNCLSRWELPKESIYVISFTHKHATTCNKHCNKMISKCLFCFSNPCLQRMKETCAYSIAWENHSLSLINVCNRVSAIYLCLILNACTQFNCSCFHWHVCPMLRILSTEVWNFVFKTCDDFNLSHAGYFSKFPKG